MAGIFPSTGVAAANAFNSRADLTVIAGCTPLFYASKCNPRLDTASANALISEVAGVSVCAGIQYDCTRLDNLCTAINKLIADALEAYVPPTTGPGAVVVPAGPASII